MLTLKRRLTVARKGDDEKCLNCGQTRRMVREDEAECATGRWGYDGEFDYDREWPRHRWTAKQVSSRAGDSNG
jgi:hypothetical protein